MRDTYILAFALVLGSIGHLATDIYLPSLPNITEYFATNTTSVQLTLTSYMLSFCLTPLIMGPISDQIGRKKPILLGLIIGLISTIACIFATNIYILILARFFQGIGLGMVATLSRTILPDNFSGQKLAKNFSYLTMFVPLVLAIGPPLGGIIQDHSSWETVFGFLIGYIVLLFFIVKFYFQDKSLANGSSQHASFPGNDKSQDYKIRKVKVNQKHQMILSYGTLLTNAKFLRYSLCSVLLFMGITAYLTVNPFLFQNVFHLTPTENGCIALILFASTFISGFINSRLIDKYPGKNMLYLAGALIFISGVLLASISFFNEITHITFILLILPFFLGVPIIFSVAGSFALSSVRGNYGAATAMMTTLQYLGGALSSFLISFADQTKVQPLGYTFLILGILYFFTLFSERSEEVEVRNNPEKAPLLEMEN